MSVYASLSASAVLTELCLTHTTTATAPATPRLPPSCFPRLPEWPCRRWTPPPSSAGTRHAPLRSPSVAVINTIIAILFISRTYLEEAIILNANSATVALQQVGVLHAMSHNPPNSHIPYVY